MATWRPAVSIRAARVVGFGAAGLAAALNAQDDGRFSFRTGIEQSSGDYGGSEDLQDLYVPFTLLYEGRRVAFRATVPYLEVEFTDAVDASTYTQSGLGDVLLGLTFYEVLRSSDRSVAVDLTTKVELGTGDEEKGLGTGEADYAVQADLYKFLDRSTLVGSVGYKVRGEPANITIDDTWFVSMGGIYRFSTATSGGLFLDYRQSSVPGFESIRELTGSLSRDLDGPWRVQGYIVRGLSDTSLDWGAGFSVRRHF